MKYLRVAAHLHHLAATLALFVGIDASAAVLHVNLNSTNPTPPYASWATAATIIQDAVDEAAVGDTVLVTNGLYATGGRRLFSPDITNRVAITNAIIVKSVNGPAVTAIEGYRVSDLSSLSNAIRCAFLPAGAVLSGFTLTNGSAGTGNFCNGGGASSTPGLPPGGVVSNCVLVGNYASGAGGGAYRCILLDCVLSGNVAAGGGAAADSALINCQIAGNTAQSSGGTLACPATNCVFTGNYAANYGGASEYSTLVNCTLLANSARNGGGTHQSTLINCLVAQNTAFSGGGGYGGTWYNCTLSANSATNDGGGVAGGTGAWLWNCIAWSNSAPVFPDLGGAKFDYCCTTSPLGEGSITNPPSFVNPASGDYRLQTNSPCINAGKNSFATSHPDLDGNPRIQGGTVDIGAYEFQRPASVISYAWLQQYGLLIDGSADFLDPDMDGQNTWQEWICGTNPTNALSVLKLGAPFNSLSGISLNWLSVSRKMYYLERSTNLLLQPPFSVIRSNLFGQADVTSFTDASATNAGPYFYRIGVQP